MTFKTINRVSYNNTSVKSIISFIIHDILKGLMFNKVVVVPSYLLRQVNKIMCSFYIIHNFYLIKNIKLDKESNNNN